MIDENLLSKFKEQYLEDPKNLASQQAISNLGFEKASFNHNIKAKHPFVFSEEITTGKMTHQKHSGRCWMYAAMNASRVSTLKKLNVDDFHYSKTYTLFIDKLEKANSFLSYIIETAEQPLHSRLVDHLMASPCEDGGYWAWSAGILKKYGGVPECVMPETKNSEMTHQLNEQLNVHLRTFACELRQMHAEGMNKTSLEAEKNKRLFSIYRILTKALGQLPSHFSYSYRDKDKNFHRIENITPKEFFEKYCDYDVDAHTDLVNVPLESRPYYQSYRLSYTQSILESTNKGYINVPLDVLKQAAIKAIKDGCALWFACDVERLTDRPTGIMDLDVFAYDDTVGPRTRLSKGKRLEYRIDSINHAMTLIGVDLDKNDHPINWKVENSWGEKMGDKGVFSMSDAWFDEFVYEVIVPNTYLDEEILKAADKEPVMLDPWDIMC